jgi:hypothetical protein
MLDCLRRRMMVEIVAAVGNDGVACADCCEKLRRRSEAAAVMADLKHFGMKIGVTREQDIF